MLRWYIISVSLVWTLSLSGQADKHRDFLPPYNFHVDSVSLLATWEAPKIILLEEDFEGDAFPPAGWSATSLGKGWQGVESPGFRYWVVPEHPSSFALANDDSASYSNDGSMDYLITPVINLTVADSFHLYFDYYFDGAYGQRAFLEYSLDSGTTWQLLKQIDADLEWQHLEVDLSQFSGLEGETDLQLAFHADDNGYFASGWGIDNVMVSSNQNPDELLGYRVYLDDMFVGQVTITAYQYHCIYYTYHTCKVYACYQDGISEPGQQDLISYYLTKPDSLTGYAPDNAAILIWYPPLEYHPAPQKQSNRAQPQDQMMSTDFRDVGDIILSWPSPSPISSCYGICDDGNNLWITDPVVSATSIYEVTYDGVNTGNMVMVSLGQSWIGDMVSDGDYLYGCLVGGPNTIVKVELATGETVGTIGGAWTVASQRGLAADFINEEFYIGGWSSNQIWRTDFTGATISTYGFAGVSGLAWHPTGGPDQAGSLWIMVSAGSDLCTEVDPNNSWATIQSFVLPDDQAYSGAGAEIKRSMPDGGALWLPNRSNNTVYLVDIQEPWTPHDGEWIIPFNLIGFNIYRSNNFIAYVGYTEPDSCYYIDPIDFYDSSYYNYEVTALYDLNAYGFPGDTGESLPDGPAEVTSCCWNDLDFFEDWSLIPNGNLWKFFGNNWKVDPEIGNEAPAAVFSPDSVLLQYKDTLQSYLFITGTEMPVDVILEYDVFLSSVNTSGNEKLLVQVYDYFDGTWNTVRTYDNAGGSFGWQRDTINITHIFNDGGFRIRFTAQGENSAHINLWAVDNIAVRREFYPPENITASILPSSEDSILVSWDEPLPEIAEWREWDDGILANKVGFGSGKNDWASCAILWSPEQLAALKGANLTAIGFIPGEGSTFYKIAIWTGDNKDLIYLQAAGNLIVDQWNIIPLDQPLKVDITKDLLVGYKLAEYMGYPMAADDGPAIDGFGNLTQFQQNQEWQTLLQVNPNFDWNWNIKAYFERDGYPVTAYKLFRSLDGGSPELIAEPEAVEYIDTASAAYTTFCYRLKSVFNYEFESPYSEEACVVITNSDPVELANEGLLKIFPNPSDRSVSIESSENIDMISLYNSFGELILKKKVDEKQLEIPVAAYPAGVYMIRVETDVEMISKKIVVMH